MLPKKCFRSFYTAKETIDKKKKKTTMYGMEKIFSNDMTSKGLISKINNELTQLNILKQQTI